MDTSDGSAASNIVASSNVDYVAGHAGMAVRVDNASSISIAETDSLDQASLTIEGWIRSTGTIRGTVFDNDNQYGLFINSGGALHCLVVLGQGNFRNAVGGTIPLDTWTHVACVYDSLIGLQVYVDANPVDSDNRSPGALADLGNNGATVASDTGADPFVGELDTLRIWNRALSTSELEQIVANE